MRNGLRGCKKGVVSMRNGHSNTAGLAHNIPQKPWEIVELEWTRGNQGKTRDD